MGAAALAFCVLISVSPARPIYDEPWFLDTIVLFKQRGFTVDFFREFPGAPGPTFTIVYALIDRVLALAFPWSRFISFTLLIAATFLMWRILKMTLAGRDPASAALSPNAVPSPALLAASFTMLPTVGVSASMILTEMPAALFMVAALWLLGKISPTRPGNLCPFRPPLYAG